VTTDSERTLPKWLVPVVVTVAIAAVPALVAAVRNEIITTQNAQAVQRIEDRLQSHMEEESRTRQAAAEERYRMNQKIFYLCIERERDNASTSAAPGTSGACPQ